MFDLKIYTSSNGPLSVEQLSEMATNEIIKISDSSPAPLREQAHLFKDHVEQVIAKYMKQALASNLSYMVKETRQ